jgi:hypothetical protein
MEPRKTAEISLSIQAQVNNRLVELASENGFALEELCCTILSLWATHGGTIWLGRKWRVIDWPKKFLFLEKETVSQRT